MHDPAADLERIHHHDCPGPAAAHGCPHDDHRAAYDRAAGHHRAPDHAGTRGSPSTPATTRPGGPEYRTCLDALMAGASPSAGATPATAPHLDDDNDGTACEWGEGFYDRSRASRRSFGEPWASLARTHDEAQPKLR